MESSRARLNQSNSKYVINYQLLLAAFSAIVYAIEKEPKMVNQLCLSPEDRTQLAELTISDIRELAEIGGHFLDLTRIIKKESLTVLLKENKACKKEKILLGELVAGGAPLALIAVFDKKITSTKFAEMRARHNMPPASGKLRQATPEELRLVRQELFTLYPNDFNFTHIGPKHYLILHQATGISLRVIWPAIEAIASVEMAKREREANKKATVTNMRKKI